MADEELEVLHKQRLAELQAKHWDPSSDIVQWELSPWYFKTQIFTPAQMIFQNYNGGWKICMFAFPNKIIFSPS